MCFWTIACSAAPDGPNDPDPNELNDALGAEPNWPENDDCELGAEANDGPENDWDPTNDWLDPEPPNEAPPLKTGAEAEI